MNRRDALLALGLIALASAPGARAAAARPLVKVFKNESCGCCQLWVEHLEKAGFATEVHHLDNLGPIKESAGIPVGLGSCHTAEVGGYFVEGHVPAADIQRLLREKPDAKGLVVPRMPVGSPGMETASGKAEAYDVLLVARDGTTSVYMHHAGT
ncbi:MAG TPA: DUF411 domain-containing protein [Steroidobacteraceae bacterium]|nr:DUF411 domain-containing protein [Steroidobacteraceae bacterium]